MKIDSMFFRKNGYLLIDNAYSSDELISFREMLYATLCYALKENADTYALDKNLPLEIKCDGLILKLRQICPNIMSRVQATISRTPEYYRLCSSPVVMKAVRSLLGVTIESPLYMTNNGIIFTNPNDELNKRPSNIQIDAHKDTFFTLPGSRFLHVWAPLLHNATEEIGTLQIFPGSHKDGIGKQSMDPLAPYDHRYFVPEHVYSEYEAVSINMELGQALIFDGHMIHRSGKNTSDHVRCTLIGLHHDAGKEGFSPLAVEYKYKDLTPEGYYYQLYKDEKALPLIHEQAL